YGHGSDSGRVSRHDAGMGQARLGLVPSSEVVSPDSSSVTDWKKRAERAKVLAQRYAASREILMFYAGVAGWQATGKPRAPFATLPGLLHSIVDLVASTGPRTLAEAGRDLYLEAHFDTLFRSYWQSPPQERDASSGARFFVHAVMQAYAAHLQG